MMKLSNNIGMNRKIFFSEKDPKKRLEMLEQGFEDFDWDDYEKEEDEDVGDWMKETLSEWARMEGGYDDWVADYNKMKYASLSADGRRPENTGLYTPYG